jgi:hypothetical protein
MLVRNSTIQNTMLPKDLLKISWPYRVRTVSVQYTIIPYSCATVLMFHKKSSSVLLDDDDIGVMRTATVPYKAAPCSTHAVLSWDHGPVGRGHHDEIVYFADFRFNGSVLDK